MATFVSILTSEMCISRDDIRGLADDHLSIISGDATDATEVPTLDSRGRSGRRLGCHRMGSVCMCSKSVRLSLLN